MRNKKQRLEDSKIVQSEGLNRTQVLQVMKISKERSSKYQQTEITSFKQKNNEKSQNTLRYVSIRLPQIDLKSKQMEKDRKQGQSQLYKSEKNFSPSAFQEEQMILKNKKRNEGTQKNYRDYIISQYQAEQQAKDQEASEQIDLALKQNVFGSQIMKTRNESQRDNKIKLITSTNVESYLQGRNQAKQLSPKSMKAQSMDLRFQRARQNRLSGIDYLTNEITKDQRRTKACQKPLQNIRYEKMEIERQANESNYYDNQE